jgi:hypothetical protein
MTSGRPDALYRGHNSYAWELESTLERALLAHARSWNPARYEIMTSMVDDKDTGEWALEVESALTHQFRSRATRMGLPDFPPPWDRLGWWELMQHHRAPTRLLDWTTSPFVGLWFAIDGHRPEEGDMALWVYDRQTARINLRAHMATLRQEADYDSLTDRELQNRLVNVALAEVSDLLIPMTPRQFPRAIAQRSILTLSPNVALTRPTRMWIREQLTTRIRLKADWKPEIHAACRSAGISRFNLFQDLDTLGDDIKEAFLSSGEPPDPL